MARPKFYSNGFAKLLRQALKGKTDLWLAKRLGVSRSLVTHWRTGRSIPSPETIADICDHVGQHPLVFLEAAATASGEVRLSAHTPNRARILALLSCQWMHISEAQEMALIGQLFAFQA
jgi:transcriptional regulator with XRE-family HTH domain